MVGKNFPREVTPSKSVAQSYSTDSVRQLSEETSFEQPGLHDDVSQTRSPPPSNVRGCMTSRQASAPFNEAVDKLPKPETMPAPYSSRYGAQPVIFLSKLINLFVLYILILEMYFLIVNKTNFRADLSDVSAKTATACATSSFVLEIELHCFGHSDALILIISYLILLVCRVALAIHRHARLVAL